MLALSCVATNLVGMVMAFRTGLRPLLLMCSSFNLCWLSFPALYQISTRSAAWGDSSLFTFPSAITSALGMNLALSVTFLCTYALYRARPTPSADAASEARPRPRQRVAGKWMILGSLVLLPFIAAQMGGFGNLFSSRSGVNELLAQQGLTLQIAGGGIIALIRIVPGALAVAGTLLVLHANRHQERRKMREHLWPFLGIVLIFTYTNPLVNTRFTFLAAALPVLLLVFRPRSARAGGLIAIGCVGVFAAVYPFVNALQGSRSSVFASGGVSMTAFASRDFDGFQQLVNSVLFSEENGHTSGRYVLSSLLFFVPRSIWNDKSVPASVDVAAFRGYRFTNLSLPLQAEVALDLGLVFALVLAVIVAIVWRKLDDKWQGTSATIPLIALLAAAQIGLIRGPLGAQVPVVGLTIALVAVGVSLDRRKKLSDIEVARTFTSARSRIRR